MALLLLPWRQVSGWSLSIRPHMHQTLARAQRMISLIIAVKGCGSNPR